jgi:hypothetical protein
MEHSLPNDLTDLNAFLENHFPTQINQNNHNDSMNEEHDDIHLSENYIDNLPSEAKYKNAAQKTFTGLLLTDLMVKGSLLLMSLVFLLKELEENFPKP